METERFDEITKALTADASRRTTVKALFGGAAASLLAIASLEEADARAKRGKRGKRAKRGKRNRKAAHNTIVAPPPTDGTTDGGSTDNVGGAKDCKYGYDDYGQCYTDTTHCQYGWDYEHEKCYKDDSYCEYGYDYEHDKCYEDASYCGYGWDYDKHECYDGSSCEYGWDYENYECYAPPPYECDYGYDYVAEQCYKKEPKCDYGYDAYGQCYPEPVCDFYLCPYGCEYDEYYNVICKIIVVAE